MEHVLKDDFLPQQIRITIFKPKIKDITLQKSATFIVKFKLIGSLARIKGLKGSSVQK